MIFKKFWTEERKEARQKHHSHGMARELLYTQVTMGTPPHIAASMNLLKRDEVSPSQKPRQTSASEPDAVNAVVPDFGLLVGQLLGIIAQDVQQETQQEESLGNAGNLTPTQAPPASQGATGRSPEISELFFGAQDEENAQKDGGTGSQVATSRPPEISELFVSVQNKEDAPKDGRTAPQVATSRPPEISELLLGVQNKKDALKEEETTRQFSKLMPNGNPGKKDPAEKVSTENVSAEKIVKPDMHAPADKKAFYPTAQAAEGDPGTQQNTAIAGARKQKEDLEPPQASTTKGPMASGTTDFPTLVQHDASGAQFQSARAAASAGPVNTGGDQHVRAQATDPAEAFDNTVSITKDGNGLAVKLAPDGLGKLDIDLRLDKGVVSAQIHVSDTGTKNLIENNMQQLVDGLLKDGLSVGGFSVSMKNSGARDEAAENYRNNLGKQQGLSPHAMSEAGKTAAAQGLVNIFI